MRTLKYYTQRNARVDINAKCHAEMYAKSFTAYNYVYIWCTCAGWRMHGNTCSIGISNIARSLQTVPTILQCSSGGRLGISTNGVEFRREIGAHPFNTLLREIFKYTSCHTISTGLANNNWPVWMCFNRSHTVTPTFVHVMQFTAQSLIDFGQLNYAENGVAHWRPSSSEISGSNLWCASVAHVSEVISVSYEIGFWWCRMMPVRRLRCVYTHARTLISGIWFSAKHLHAIST